MLHLLPFSSVKPHPSLRGEAAPRVSEVTALTGQGEEGPWRGAADRLLVHHRLVCVCVCEAEELRSYGDQGPGVALNLPLQFHAGMRGNIPLIVVFNRQTVKTELCWF